MQKSSENGAFDDVVQDISSRCPSIDLPWLDIETRLAEIRRNFVRPECETANNTVTLVNSGKVASATADYSHLYIYKKNSPAETASLSEKTSEYIALSSSSSSDEDEGDRPCVFQTADISGVDSMTGTDTTATANVQTARFSTLYRSANTGVQITNPNKKRKKK